MVDPPMKEPLEIGGIYKIFLAGEELPVVYTGCFDNGSDNRILSWINCSPEAFGRRFNTVVKKDSLQYEELIVAKKFGVLGEEDFAKLERLTYLRADERADERATVPVKDLFEKIQKYTFFS